MFPRAVARKTDLAKQVWVSRPSDFKIFQLSGELERLADHCCSRRARISGSSSNQCAIVLFLNPDQLFGIALQIVAGSQEQHGKVGNHPA